MTSSRGKTAWFTLTAQSGPAQTAQHAEPELEPGA